MIAEQLRRTVPGGIGTYTRGLLRGLANHPDVAVVAWASATAGEDPIEVLVGAANTETIRLPSRALTQLWDRGLLRAPGNTDWCHATSLLTPGVTNGAGTAQHNPQLSVFVHDVGWRSHPDAYPSRGVRWHAAALRRVHERADLVLCPSLNTADALVSDGFAAEHVRVVDEGADHLPLYPPAEEGTYLLAVATREPRKNLVRLVAAYALARPQLPEPWPLRIVGPAGWGTDVRPVPGVELIGPVSDDDLARAYAGARLFAYVPLSEGYGLPPLEAMRAGLPVLSSAVPSVGGGALLVDPLDVAAIAGQIVRLATDRSLREEFRVRGAERAAASTWRACADQHVACWESR